MTSAVTGMSVTSTQAPANAAVPAIAAVSIEAPSQPRPGMSPAAQASVPDPPGNGAPKPAAVAIQVSHALLGLSVPDTANSATAPDTGPPPTATPIVLGMPSTGYTEFAVNAAAASQTAENDSTGDGSGGSTDSSASDSSASQDDAAIMPGQGIASATGTPGSSTKPAQTHGHIAFSPLPVIPQWHIRPKMKTA